VKIAIVNQPWNTPLPPLETPDSIAIVSHHLARHLAGAHDVVVYGRGGWPRTVEAEHVRYRLVPVILDQLVAELAGRLAFLRDARRPVHASTAYYALYAVQVALDLRRRGTDVAHLHTFPGFIRIVRALNPGVRIVFHMHDDSLPKRDRRITERRLLEADVILGCSEFITGNIRRAYTAVAPRCRTLWNGVDPEQFQGAPGPSGAGVRFLFVGRVSPEKGVHLLIEAFRRVAERRPDVEMEIAGPRWVAFKEFIDPLDEDPLVRELSPFYERRRSYFAHLDRLLERVPAGRVRFCGTIPQRELRKHYGRADVLVNPSLCEAFGMSLVEAMARGIPVIASRTGGMTEIVEPSGAGLLVARGSVEELTEAMERLAGDADLRRSMGERGQRHARERFAWDVVAGRLLEVYGAPRRG
jgi:glycosyltransferase involved in cell wall biosynthesis